MIAIPHCESPDCLSGYGPWCLHCVNQSLTSLPLKSFIQHLLVLMTPSYRQRPLEETAVPWVKCLSLGDSITALLTPLCPNNTDT